MDIILIGGIETPAVGIVIDSGNVSMARQCHCLVGNSIGRVVCCGQGNEYSRTSESLTVCTIVLRRAKLKGSLLEKDHWVVRVTSQFNPRLRRYRRDRCAPEGGVAQGRFTAIPAFMTEACDLYISGIIYILVVEKDEIDPSCVGDLDRCKFRIGGTLQFQGRVQNATIPLARLLVHVTEVVVAIDIK